MLLLEEAPQQMGRLSFSPARFAIEEGSRPRWSKSLEL
jgi:hypothetical protein